MSISSSQDSMPAIETTSKSRRLRSLRDASGTIVTGIGVLLVLYHLAYLSNFFEYIDIYIPSEAHRAMSLAFLLGITFLIVPASKSAPRNIVPWYDVILALASMAGPLYMFRFFFRWELARIIQLPSTPQVILGAATVVLVLEATRRTVGFVVVALIVLFQLHPFIGQYLSGSLYAPSYSVARVVSYLIYSTNGVYGSVMDVTATIIIMFIIFSRFLHATGAGDFFINIALSLFGRLRGGPAKVAVVASSMFGTMCGSTVANVVTTGIVTIPMMKRCGYKPYMAGAVEATASCGGQIMPPVMGSAAFLAAEFLGIPYIYFAAAAVGPAILYYLAVFVMVDLHGAKESGLKKVSREELPRIKDQLKVGWIYIIPLMVLVYFLAVRGYNPSKSAIYSLATLLLLSMLRKDTRIRLGPRKLIFHLRDAAFGMLEVGAIGAGIGIIIGSLDLTSMGLNLARVLVEVSGGNLFILLLLAAVGSLILGMGMPTVPAYILVAILVLPAVIKMGVEPIVAHMFVFYFCCISLITPPVCVGSYVAAGLAEAPMLLTALKACQLGIVGLIVPFFFIYTPGLLLIGNPAEIAAAFIIGCVGTISLGSGLSGYLLQDENWLERLLFIGGAGLVLFPHLAMVVIGGGMIAIGIAWQVAKRKKLWLYK